jgi:succinyl-CoA synthetase beta subunit
LKLLEYEGKQMLGRHGIPVPEGSLWPDVPEAAAWVVKAQVMTGGRGKRGGIRTADSRAEIERHVLDLESGGLNGEPLRGSYIEERLLVDREFYLAAFVNRDSARVSVLASSSGGVDIESVPETELAQIDIDPLVGLADFQLRHIVDCLDLPATRRDAFADLVVRLVAALGAEDAELIEINPLVLTVAGDFVAADVKATLDDDAVFRHPGRATPVAWREDGEFAQACRKLGVIGVDNRPNLPAGPPSVAIMGNGAGLTMATYDQVALAGLGVAGAIELHGALSRGVEHMTDVIKALFLLNADVIFINAFYQLRSCDGLAEALADALRSGSAPDPNRVAVRLRGLGELTSQGIAAAAGCFVSSSLRDTADRVFECVTSLAVSEQNA